MDYDECCALLILKELFPDKYGSLRLADKPDLQGDDIGVEVTKAGEKETYEAINNWVIACHSDDESRKQHSIERMKQLGVEYTGGFQVWPGVVPKFLYIKQAVDAKISKLEKGGYYVFSKYELFIFTDTWMTDQIICEACEYFAKVSVYQYFSIIYILEEGSKLHVFDETAHIIREIEISEQTERNIRAWEMVNVTEK